MTYCRICKENPPTPHYCYISSLKKKENSNETLYIFYDFETTQNELIENSNGKFRHTPNLCVAFQLCNKCPEIVNVIDLREKYLKNLIH
jgi:hypothetical protein